MQIKQVKLSPVFKMWVSSGFFFLFGCKTLCGWLKKILLHYFVNQKLKQKKTYIHKLKSLKIYFKNLIEQMNFVLKFVSLKFVKTKK